MLGIKAEFLITNLIAQDTKETLKNKNISERKLVKKLLL